ncbi:TRAP-type mannitol/chloroaromatic compound transport system substrate-binding protein [Rhodobium orientis]|uniref:ABC transporter substrate-binding protein n=1 Tax=Rhodobium orientis TaxID=34017 RepID=A0A327JJE2_9HYPH|nr:TRAP transporter substrate-binding protein [Rhodobium orientis]MBB4302874.1 TRAP-type mannitol/chloroaromatic compound transport system substrate-binding protein [Rhodobium orientis]MBK5949435.1 ABC transporter substrate-binding protein [Rhodobium orientis]RAI26005.1 ABC transporter substrate-binding protein [Rhodobium orientis]
MDRRSFLKKAGLATAGGAAASTLAAPAIAQGNMELKMVTTWPKNFPGLGTGAQRVADRITAMTDGRITVKLYAANELVPAFESFDAVSTGTADLYHGAEYYWQGKHKAFNFFAAVPLGLTAAELDAWINHMGGQELWDELSAGFNVKSFIAGNTGVQMGGWFNKEINSLEDLKGLKMRIPGLGGEVLRRLGATAVSLPGGEIFPSLQSGAIDATEWVGPWNDLAFGFYKITKYYYWPGFHEPGSGLSMGINKGVWDKLSDSDKAIFAGAAHAETNMMYSEFNANNGNALDTLVNKHGVTLREFPEDVWAAVAKVCDEVVDESADDDMGKRVLESFHKARNNVGRWNDIGEKAYLNARSKALFG